MKRPAEAILADDGDWSDLARPSADNGGTTMIQAAQMCSRPMSEVRAAFVWGDLGKPDQWAVWYADPAKVRGFFQPQDCRQSMASAATSRARSEAQQLREQIRRVEP